MRKFYVLLFVLGIVQAQAQVSDAYKNQIETIFQNVNRSLVTTGLLADYGLYYTNLDKFNGILSDTNYLEFSEWQDLYSTLYTCRFSALSSIADPSATLSLVDSIAALNSSAILLTGLHYNYHKFKSNAVPTLVYISNNKIYDKPGRPSSPYELKEAFGVVPMISSLEGANHTFLFKPEFFFSNTGKTISNLSVDFGNGLGFITVTANIPVPVSYQSEGEKILRFKVTYTDNSFRESRTKIEITDLPQEQIFARYKGTNIDEKQFPLAGFPAPKAYQGKVGGAKVTIEYTNPEKKIRKPLIIVEGFDPWKIMTPNNPSINYSFEDLISKNGIVGQGLNVLIDYTHNGTYYANLSDALQGEKFDLIFVDFDNGTDYIQRNAFLVENIIEWVNSVKEPYNGVMQKNIVMGASMGGLVARYALRDMELSNPVINHDTKLYVSFDTPHQGANFPIAFQAAVSHFNGMGIGVGVPGITYFPEKFQFGKISPDLGKSYKLLNSPAARQMLYYSVVGAGNLISTDNTIHNTFMTDYTSKGYPQTGGIRNLVIANGSECGTDQGYSPHAEFVNFDKRIRLKFWENFLANIGGPLAFLTNYPQAAIGSPLTTRTDIILQFVLNSLPDQSNQRVYKGKLTIKKKILFIIDINITIFDKSFNAPSNYLPIDNNGGGLRDLSELTGKLPFSLKQTRFSFVPTFSALDIGGGLQPVTSAEVKRPYSPSLPPASPKNVYAANFFANPSENGSSNEIHTQVTLRNGRWLLQEITGTAAFFSCAYKCSDPSISPALAGNELICNGSNVNYTSSNLPAAPSLSWTSSSNLSYVSGQGTNGYTINNPSPTAQGFASISLDITADCQTRTVSKTVWIGKPAAIETIWFNGERDGPFEACKNLNYNFEVEDNINIDGTTYSWISPGIGTVVLGQGTANARIKMHNAVNSGYVSVRPVNGCGNGVLFDAPIDVISCSGFAGSSQMSIYPNPASEELLISYQDDSLSQTTALAEPVVIELINPMLEKVYSQETKNSVTRIPIADLPKGMYYLNIKRKRGVLQRQIKIDH